MHFPFFHRKQSLQDLDILRGMTDWHCHILPGVDDGIANMTEALKVLDFYEKLGIYEVWLTPHIIEDIPNTTEALRKRFHDLQDAYKGNIKLHLASENMVDGLFLQRLEANDLLPLGHDADNILVEFSYIQAPIGLYNTLERIKEKGYCPILAHPERYSYMSVNELAILKKKGVKLQLNLPSLVGMYGTTVQKKAKKLLDLRLYDICGSDLHSLHHFQEAITQRNIDDEVADHIAYCFK